MTIYTGSGTVVAPAGAVGAFVEAWGAGGNGGSSTFGGGGGAYAGNFSLAISGGNTLTYNCGSGVPGNPTSSWVSTTGSQPTTLSQGVLAVGGGPGTSSGLGGLASSCIGSVKFSGGNGDGVSTRVGGGGAGSGGNGQSGSSPTFGAGGPPDGGAGGSVGSSPFFIPQASPASFPGGGGAAGGIYTYGGDGQVRIVFYFNVHLVGRIRAALNARIQLQQAQQGVKHYSYTQNIPAVISQVSFAAQISAALAAVQAALSSIPVLRDATLVQLQPVSLAVSSALTTFANIRMILDSQLSTVSVGGIVPGLPAPQIVSTYLQQLNIAQQLNVLINAEAYIGRILTNLEQATG